MAGVVERGNGTVYWTVGRSFLHCKHSVRLVCPVAGGQGPNETGPRGCRLGDSSLRSGKQRRRMRNVSPGEGTTVGSALSAESSGDAWLQAVTQAGQDLVRNRPSDPEAVRDSVLERARALVPRNAHERWELFVDLGAYRGDDDMTTAAGEAVRVVAERLLTLLVDGDEEK